jgi:hypothetical protein
VNQLEAHAALPAAGQRATVVSLNRLGLQKLDAALGQLSHRLQHLGWPTHHQLQQELQRSAERCSMGLNQLRQRLRVLPSASSIAPGTDVRSNAAKAVANIEAMLSGTASLEARRYRINNRELERYTVGELLQLLSFWRRELWAEDRRAAGLSSLGPRIAVTV